MFMVMVDQLNNIKYLKKQAGWVWMGKWVHVSILREQYISIVKEAKRQKKGKERVKINRDEREQIREEERRKIKNLRKENMPPIVVMTLARA